MICEPINTTDVSEVKRCSKCGELKILSEFYIDKMKKFGVSGKCIICTLKYQAERRQAHRERINNQKRLHWDKNKTIINLKRKLEKTSEQRRRKSEYDRTYRSENSEKVKLSQKRKYNNNKNKYSNYHKNRRKIYPEIGRVKNAKRRAKKISASPLWLSDVQIKNIKLIYEDAAWLTMLTGVVHTVDHIHPLQGKNFSGLHVPWNLQILTFSENSSKCNKPPPEEAHLFWGI